MLFAKHPEQNARDGHDASERARGKQTGDSFSAFKITQADHPSGDACSENGTKDDGNGLAELHQTGVDKADSHDSGCT